MMRVLLAFTGAMVAEGHGTVTLPAMRNNPTISGGWCPWCQGEQDFCNPSDTNPCNPPSPCWGATPGETVGPDKFNDFNKVPSPDGTPWIDQTGGTDKVTMWCPGKTVPIRFYINADHNGVVRWESQLAAPGSETEEGFKNFTSWVSFNNDPATKYYDKDGITLLKPDTCTWASFNNTLDLGVPWTPEVAHCRDDVWAESLLTLPADFPTGQTVFRWFWYGAMKTDGTRVMGPEHSLFANCADIVVGTPEQCGDLEPVAV